MKTFRIYIKNSPQIPFVEVRGEKIDSGKSSILVKVGEEVVAAFLNSETIGFVVLDS